VRSLAGRRILITRARQQAGSLASALQALGAEVLAAPMIEIAPPESYAPLDAELQNLERFDWLILTSGNGARVFAERTALLGIQPNSTPRLRIAAIGPATAQALQENGWPVHCTPKAYVAESLLEELRTQIADKRVLLVRARVARDVIPAALAQLHVQLTLADAYQTLVPAGAGEQLQAIFANADRLPHLVSFTSASTVQNFFLLLRMAGLPALPAGIATASIGPITSQALREHGLALSIEAAEHTIPGLTAAIAAYFSR
jgi:uroporphyrinogen-III synthase